MSQDSKDAREQLAYLHQCYKGGTLRVLAGAGVAMGSGIPGWDALNLGLLCEAIRADHGQHPLVAESDVQMFAEALYERLGRDASADFVWHALEEDRFYEELARCLYGGRSIEDLPVRATQKQLAALARKSSSPGTLFTTNYDPLLEKAIAKLAGTPDTWAAHRRPFAADDSRKEATPAVRHIHGWLDPDGRRGGTLVLTETSYLDLALEQTAAPNTMLSQLLNNDGPLVIVGMSLSDPNLRRLLHHRRRRSLGSPSNQVFAIMSRDGSPSDASLVQYWESWKVMLLFVDHYDYIPSLLRDIVWGTSSNILWFDIAHRWVNEQIPESLLFSDQWQKFASQSLHDLQKRVKTYFAVDLEEELVFSVFLPVRQQGAAAIWKVASSRGQPRTGTEAKAHARDRTLRISRHGSQGVAGRSFEEGVPIEVLDNGPGLDRGFDADMVARWEEDHHFRSWRSILAVPVLDSEDWVPIAVMTVTSNAAAPFWSRFEDRTPTELPVLKRLMRRVAKWMIAQHELPCGEGLP